MLAESRITDIVAATVREQLAPCAVELHVTGGTDEDGDDILNVIVVIQRGCEPDTRRMLGLVRHLRSRLQEAANEAFPIVSFISRRDADKAGL